MRIYVMANANVGVFSKDIHSMLRSGWFLVVRPVNRASSALWSSIKPDGWELLGLFPSLELAQGYAGGCFEDELVCIKV